MDLLDHTGIAGTLVIGDMHDELGWITIAFHDEVMDRHRIFWVVRCQGQNPTAAVFFTTGTIGGQGRDELGDQGMGLADVETIVLGLFENHLGGQRGFIGSGSSRSLFGIRHVALLLVSGCSGLLRLDEIPQRAEIVGGLLGILLNCHDLVSFRSVEK